MDNQTTAEVNMTKRSLLGLHTLWHVLAMRFNSDCALCREQGREYLESGRAKLTYLQERLAQIRAGQHSAAGVRVLVDRHPGTEAADEPPIMRDGPFVDDGTLAPEEATVPVIVSVRNRMGE